MKMDVHSEQEKVHQITGGFLRLDRSEEALWVSDYPRRNADVHVAEERLKELGVRCLLDEKAKLWHLDWTKEKWAQEVASLPETLPALPADEHLHDVYAFCRFALAHPAKWTQESLKMLRCAMKNSIPVSKMHEQAAQSLRQGKSIAYEAGRFLTARLKEREDQR